VNPRQLSAPILAGCCALAGCASITGSPMQSITIQAFDRAGKAVDGAACELVNSKGRWLVATPGSVVISRSNENMLITCRKDGHDEGIAALVSATKGEMFGNIILGGGIGAIIDHNSGSAYEYPQSVQVEMGSTRVISPPEPAPPPRR
jgi:hypothetical protein